MPKLPTITTLDDLDRLVEGDPLILRDVAARLLEQRDTLAAFARWLVAMDDPDNLDGMAERRSITLTRIIDRARKALGEAG
jgi:hypothetical protein